MSKIDTLRADHDRSKPDGLVRLGQSALRRHSSLAFMLVLGTFCMIDAAILSSLLTPIKNTLGLSDEGFGRTSAAFTVAGMLAAPLFGALASRFSRKPVLFFSVVVWSLASAGGALATGLATLMLWRALTGFGEAAYQGLAPGWLADLYGKSSRNFVFSLFMLRNKIGSALALALGGWLSQSHDWRYAFLATGLPGIGLALVLLFVHEPSPGASDGVPQRRSIPVKEQVAILKIAPYRIHLIALTLFYSGTATAQMWLPAYLHRVYQLSNQAATGYLSAVLLLTAPVGLVGGYLVGRHLSQRPGGLSAALAVTSLIAAAAFALGFWTRDLGTAKILFVVAISAFGSTAGTLTTLLVETVPALLRSVAGSIGAFATAAVSGMAVPWIVGAASDRYGLDHAIFLGAAFYFAAGAIWAVTAWNNTRQISSSNAHALIKGRLVQ